MLWLPCDDVSDEIPKLRFRRTVDRSSRLRFKLRLISHRDEGTFSLVSREVYLSICSVQMRIALIIEFIAKYLLDIDTY